MERKKPDKLSFAMPTSNSDYYQMLQGGKGPAPLENANDSPFLKYASSIIQVVSQDKLDFSCSAGTAHDQKNAVFEISEIKDLRGEGVGKGNSFYQESNNYNNIAAKMKKKGGNRKLLSYNFSNLTIFHQAAHRIFKKSIKNSYDLIRYWANGSDSDYNKTKKEIKRSSFHSGYTTSTSNDEKIGKKQTKKLTQEKKKDTLREAAHQIKGFLQFKFLLVLSQAFSNISSQAKTPVTASNRLPFGVSQVSTIKNEPLQNFYLTEYSQAQQMSIVKEMTPSMSQSLIYTVDKNFAFTEVQIAVTPQKTTFAHNHQAKSPFINIKALKNNTNESIVEPYQPRSPRMPPKPISIKEKHTTAISKPLKFNQIVERRHLTVRTNIYQLPLLSKKELKMENSKGIKNLCVFRDYLSKVEPQTCISNDAILLELAQAEYLFKPKANNKIMQSSKRSTKNAYTEKLDKSQSDKWSTTNELDEDNKKLNSNPVREQRKQVKVSEYYQSQKVPSQRTARPKEQKKALQPLKSCEPSLNPIYRSQQKSQRIIKFDESVVNQFKLYQEKKQQQMINNKSQTKIQEAKAAYLKENLIKKQQKQRSASKINLLMQSPRRQSNKMAVYSPPAVSHEMKVEAKPNSKDNNGKYMINNPYCYPNPQERPTSPKIVINQPKKTALPLKQQNVYQISQGVPYIKQPVISQKIVNPINKQNEKMLPQHQIRIQNAAKPTPSKVINMNGYQQRPNMITACQVKKDEKKPNFYSPQVGKEYMQTPQKYVHIEQQKAQTAQTAQTLRRMHTEQEYFVKQSTNHPQLKAISFNNNYYTNGPQTARPVPVVSEVNRNVFMQEGRQVRLERPPSSSRQSVEKGNMILNYMSPVQSQVQYQQRSNNFSKNSSQLSRPKSMNQKIFITLRKDK